MFNNTLFKQYHEWNILQRPREWNAQQEGNMSIEATIRGLKLELPPSGEKDRIGKLFRMINDYVQIFTNEHS